MRPSQCLDQDAHPVATHYVHQTLSDQCHPEFLGPSCAVLALCIYIRLTTTVSPPVQPHHKTTNNMESQNNTPPTLSHKLISTIEISPVVQILKKKKKQQHKL